MRAAQADISVVPADLDLLTFAHRFTLCINAQIHCRLASAPANGSNLAQVICDCEQDPAAGKKRAGKIGAQAITKHRDVVLVGNARQLPNLFFCQELRLIDKHAGDWLFAVCRQDMRGQIAIALEDICWR